jgi:hypothetical protein
VSSKPFIKSGKILFGKPWITISIRRVRRCTECVLSKPAQNTIFGLLVSEVASRLFQKLFIDCVGKFPTRATIGLSSY